MTEPIKIVSPTGCVHIAHLENIIVSGSREYTTLCSHAAGRLEVTSWFLWPRTDKQVSCRRCLAQSKNPMDGLKGLAIKAADMDSDFHGLAKRFCSFFSLKSREYNPIALRICSHRRRLGTEKNPRFCNLLDCPLKYER